MSDKFVISISRQYGCGGRELAGILADKLGVKLYDRQLRHPRPLRGLRAARRAEPFRHLRVRGR